MKILIAEDDKISRHLLKKNLEKNGYEVVAARDGAEALEIYRKEPFRVVITDWIMPEIDGLDLVKTIRSLPSDDYVYIIMLTARTEKHSLVRCMEAGVDDFIAKPLDPAELNARLIACKRVLNLEKSLNEQKEELRKANRRMKTDLDAAAQIQISLLPAEPPQLENVNISWRFNPCDELAGDSFNVFNLDEKHLGLYLLDVSGHGVPAALLAVTLNRLLSPVLDDSSIIKRRLPTAPYYRIVSPSEVAANLNKRFQLTPQQGQFFTLIYGYLNTDTFQFRYISAGHPEIIHLSSGKKARMLAAPSVPIGFVEEVHYEEKLLQLQPGDRFYLYSDGVAEAQNERQEQFGAGRMAESLQRQRKESLGDGLQALLEDVTRWCQPRQVADDVSVLAVEITPEGKTLAGVVKGGRRKKVKE